MNPLANVWNVPNQRLPADKSVLYPEDDVADISHHDRTQAHVARFGRCVDHTLWAVVVQIGCAQQNRLQLRVGDVAVTFDPRSVPDIARALSQLLSDGRLQASLGKQGRVRAEAFTWRRTAEATLALYRMVAKSSGVRPI